MSKIKSSSLSYDVGVDFSNYKALTDAISGYKENGYQGNVYQRFCSSAIAHTEEKIAALAHAEWSALFPSGMSAINTALLCAKSNQKLENKYLFLNDMYPGTKSYANKVLKKLHAYDVEYVELLGEMPQFNKLLEHKILEIKPSVLFLETMTNPKLYPIDLKSIIKAVKKKNIFVIVDDTLTTPIMCNPLEYGADIVVHSATKYMSGYNNLMAGVIYGNNSSLRELIRMHRRTSGAIISPSCAEELSCQLTSFEWRFKRQCETAKKIADFLFQSKIFSHVYYPSLNIEQKSIADKNYKNMLYGAVITMRVQAELVEKFIDSLKNPIKISTSFGSCTTTVMDVSSFEDTTNLNQSSSLVRLSIGLEDYSSIINSLSTAMGCL